MCNSAEASTWKEKSNGFGPFSTANLAPVSKKYPGNS